MRYGGADMSRPDHSPEPRVESDIEAIEHDIERTREQVADTVAALGAKLDVKERVTDAVTEPDGSVKTVIPIAATIFATTIVLLGVVIWRRRR
ncbi:DUF3618 domain-containing protein [Mycolicibacterium neoaurum]|nr:DUF3618 domain-containing protein [Mycolicibacterium neoaurum]